MLEINFLKDRKNILVKLHRLIEESDNLWKVSRIVLTSLLLLSWVKKVYGMSYDQMIDLDNISNLLLALGTFVGYERIKDWSNYFHITFIFFLFLCFYKFIINTLSTLCLKVMSKN